MKLNRHCVLIRYKEVCLLVSLLAKDLFPPEHPGSEGGHELK